MQNDNFDTCPALDKELLDTSKKYLHHLSTTSTFVDLSANLEVIGRDVCHIVEIIPPPSNAYLHHCLDFEFNLIWWRQWRCFSINYGLTHDVLIFRYDFELSVKLTILDRALIDQGSKDNVNADSYEQDSINELKSGLQIPHPVHCILK